MDVTIYLEVSKFELEEGGGVIDSDTAKAMANGFSANSGALVKPGSRFSVLPDWILAQPIQSSNWPDSALATFNRPIDAAIK